MAFTFRLFGTDGDDIGVYKTARSDWFPGDVVYEAGWPKWRITAILPVGELADSEFAAFWELELLQPDLRAVPDPA
jgi:hypothetical protein